MLSLMHMPSNRIAEELLIAVKYLRIRLSRCIYLAKSNVPEAFSPLDCESL